MWSPQCNPLQEHCRGFVGMLATRRDNMLVADMLLRGPSLHACHELLHVCIDRGWVYILHHLFREDHWVVHDPGDFFRLHFDGKFVSGRGDVGIGWACTIVLRRSALELFVAGSWSLSTCRKGAPCNEISARRSSLQALWRVDGGAAGSGASVIPGGQVGRRCCR